MATRKKPVSRKVEHRRARVRGLLDEMAIACLTGDMLAARALCDILANDDDFNNYCASKELDEKPQEVTSRYRNERLNRTEPITGFELFRTKEFVALMKLLNVNLLQPILTMTLKLDIDNQVKIDMEIQGRASTEPKHPEMDHGPTQIT